MKKHLKKLGIVAVGLVALGIAGSLAGSGGRKVADSLGGADLPAQPDPVLASIDKALGRSSTELAAQPQQASTTRNSASAGAPAIAPAADSAGAASSKATTSAGTTTQAANSAGIDNQKVVQTATISMQAKDVDGVTNQIGLVAASMGGIVSASKSSTSGDQTFATITIKVPADRFQDALSQVRALGAKIDSQSSNGTDVTGEYNDLESQVRNLRATEAQLLTFLGQAKNISEVLQVQDRLNAVRNDIERLQGRMNLLEKLSDMGTISVQLRPLAVPLKVDDGKTGFADQISEAWQASLDLIGGVATGIASVLVFSWWILVLGVPALLLWQRWSRSHPAAASGAGYD